MKILLILTCLSLFTIITCHAQPAKYSFKESYELAASPEVSILSSDGNIEVVAFDGKKTDVFYIVTKNNKLLDIKREDLEKEIALEVKESGGNLSIVVKYKNEFRMLDWKDKMVVNFRIQTPRTTACKLKASDGNVSITGLKRDQELGTSDGNVDITNIDGSVIASTSDGNVTAKNITGTVEVKSSDGNIVMEDIRGNANARTSDGNIHITNVSGDVMVKSSDGDIKFKDLSGSLTANTSDGNVSGNLLKLTKELNVRTSDGNISVSIPKSLGLDLNIKGESLDVPLSNFSGKSEDNSIEGKTNGGGIPVNISTSGHVTLAYN
ncbi:MAG TPA: DUF4097 family beta strand repeat-containing protein [Chryseolinea sp.]|nr:DUF4097 family beta strand repeat-containing protein [Chryseolinea sp.]